MNKARWIAVLAASGTLVAIAGCGSASVHHQSHRRPAVLTNSDLTTLHAVGTGDTAFGLGLLGAICRTEPASNVVMSPLSVASSLGLAYLGARGETATQMAQVMHVPTTATGPLITDLRDRNELLATLDGPGITFAQSNRIWADPSLPAKSSYTAALRSAYRANLSHVPLLSDPDQARDTINAAVSKDTHGHIPELLAPGSLDDGIGWVLTNALYLKASWAQAFEAAMTRAGPFTTSSGKVTAHYLTGDGYTMAAKDGWTAVSLPYRGDRLQMLALLPPSANGSKAAKGCSLPSNSGLASLESAVKTSKQSAKIMLPKVSLSWSGALRGPLASLGMGQAFTSDADFSGISTKACCIGFVQHAATLDVAEKGTVASAATATGVSASAAEVGGISVVFNRPYLMVIEDERTSEPLMLAWVANPAAS